MAGRRFTPVELARNVAGEERTMRVTGEIVIERPIEQVFDFVADERNEPQYNPKMVRAEKITPGPVGVGTRFNSVMTGVGRGAEMTIEFTESIGRAESRKRRTCPTWTSEGSCFSSQSPKGPA